VTWDAAAWRRASGPEGRPGPGAGTRTVPGGPWAAHPARAWHGRAGNLEAGAGVDWVTMSDSCHTETARISETREAVLARSPEQREGLLQQAFRESCPALRASGIAPGVTDKTRKLTRFLLFGLTWSRLRPTVTVRNRY
jgi:hypothetical protein